MARGSGTGIRRVAFDERPHIGEASVMRCEFDDVPAGARQLTTKLVLLSAGMALAVFLANAGTPAPVKQTPVRAPSTPGGEPVMRRLTQAQYQNSIRDLFGADIKYGGRFEPEIRRAGLLAIGDGEASVTPSGIEQYDAMARVIAAQVVDESHRDLFVSCRPQNARGPDARCTEEFVDRIGRSLFRRPLSVDELALYVKMGHAAAQSADDVYVGLQTSLAMLLTAPQFLFRHEQREADPNVPGRYRLDAFSVAQRLSFLLWNTTPDPQLLDAAERGDLDTPAGLAAQVDRLLGSPRLEMGVRAFFSDILGFDAIPQISKDSTIYPAYTFLVPAAAAEQTLRTIVNHLLRERGDYRDLFTARKTELTRVLGPLYGVPVASPDGWEPFEFPADDPRAGILTHISFVSLHSHPGRSSPTLRGKAVRELLLCQRVPDPPGNVDFKLVQDTTNPEFRTARARLSVHNTERMCVGCHKLTDPIGLALEHFDSAGHYRNRENGAVIDASGELDNAKFEDAAGLGQALHDHPQLSACLVSRLFGYAAGRAPLPQEKEWLVHTQNQFAQAGFRLPELLRSIVLSDAFTRVAAPSVVDRPLTAREQSSSSETP